MWTTSASAFTQPAATSADARLGDELHRDGRVRVDLAEVEDQLREVLDRVDVVVRRRRDQRHAGLRVAQPRDLGRVTLWPGSWPPSPGFEPCAILICSSSANAAYSRRDAEAAGGDLLDPRVALGAEARRVLAALAAVRARAEAVERDRDRLVRLGRERAVRHAAGREARTIDSRRLDLVERHRPAAGTSSSRSRSSIGSRPLTSSAKRSYAVSGRVALPRRASAAARGAASTTSGSVSCGSPPLRNLT